MIGAESMRLFMTIECSQSVHSFVHDNRMLTERAFYCLGQWNVRMVRIPL